MYEIQSRARETISRRTIEQIKPVKFDWQHTGFVAQPLTKIHPAAFTFNTSSVSNPALLTITQEGDVIWNGKPSKAAEILVRSFQMRVEDEQGIIKSAKRRYYALACRNILKQAEQMEYEEFLAFLNREVYNRDRKVILDGLKD